MNIAASTLPPADYGIDAPGVVRNLLIIGVVAWLVWGGATLGYLPQVFTITLPGIRLAFPLVTTGIGWGTVSFFLAAWMLWEAKIGKMSLRDRLLGQISWTGQENVLDVGCGRGLLLIGAAKRLTTGRATGIDIWQAEDLSGNSAEATLENARREGVADRIDIQTADMRKMPFADNSFDVIVSRAAIHNIYDTAERAKAIADIARVLKPGGYALIEDIRHHQQYIAEFTKHGCADIRRIDSVLMHYLLMILTVGSVQPATLIVRKA